MSSNERHNKLRRRIIVILRDLLLWVILLPLLVIESHPRHPWSFYARLLITALFVPLGLVGLVMSFRNERKISITSQAFFLIAWLLVTLGAFWYGPLIVFGLLLFLAIRIPAIASYLRSVFANLAKSYRQMSKEI